MRIKLVSSWGLLLAVLVALALIAPGGGARVAHASVSGVVISQVYGGGGNSGATYTHDFVELFNAGSAPVSLDGWSVQYTASTSAFSAGSKVDLPNVSLQAGQYYLIQMAQGTTGGTAALPTPDLIGNAAMSATNGKAALVSSTTTLACGAASGDCFPNADIVDFVGYGSSNNSEGGATAPVLTNTTSAVRDDAGCTDTDNNGADFTAATAFPNARNTATAFNDCNADNPPAVSSTTPADNATNVAVDANILINFSEPVTVTGAWFTIACTTSGAATAVVTGGPQNYTLNPNTSFVAGETCTMTVVAAQVADQDGTPDNMAANFVFDFVTAAPLVCGTSPDKIYEIQENGSKYTVGNAFTVDGVVTGDFQLNTQLNGFFIQDPTGDGQANTSDGIFVFDPAPLLLDVVAGQYVRVTGTLTEFAHSGSSFTGGVTSVTETQLSATAVQLCTNTATVTPTPITLPFNTLDQQERFEGMLVTINGPLTVTEMFTLGRYAEISVSAGGRLFQPTNYLAPGAPAQAQQALNNRSRILIDDGSKTQNPDPIVFPAPALSAANTLRHGDTVASVTGIFTQSNSRSGNGTTTNPNPFRYRLHVTVEPAWIESNPRPTAAPQIAGATLRVASMNLLNYFNSFSGCFGPDPDPDDNCRGAENANEFTRQRDKTIAAIARLNADVIGFNEIENDAVGGGSSALEDLVAGLNAELGAGTYAFVNTGGNGQIGGDAIRVGIIYKPASVTLAGTTAVLDDVDPFNRNSRPPVAQAFTEIASGETFIFVANHFKSKGSCPNAGDPNYTDPTYGENFDTGDGQSCWNADRQKAAQAIIDWLATDPTGTGDPDVLIAGDLNAYAAEDPITLLTGAPGYVNLIAQYVGAGDEAYSYVFDGQSGYLDHALASASLAEQVVGAAEYPINADEPGVLDYNTNFKTAGQQTSLYADDEFRASDHDPIIVGLKLEAAPVGAFALKTPAGPTLEDSAYLRALPASLPITWTPASGAVEYAFILTQISGNARLGDVATIPLTPSELDCGVATAEICTFNADLNVLNLTNGLYTWTVVADNGVTTREASNAPFYFTVNFSAIELVRNGGFEAPAARPNAKIPTGWKLVNGNGERRQCNNLPGGASGCAYKGTGGPLASLTQQTTGKRLKRLAIVAGDSLTINALVQSSNAVPAASKIVVTLSSGQGKNLKTQKINVPLANTPGAAFSAIAPVTAEVTLTGTVNKITVRINTKSALFIDDLSVTLDPLAATLNAPAASGNSDLRGN